MLFKHISSSIVQVKTMRRLLKAIATLGLANIIAGLVIISHHIPAFSQSHSHQHHSSPNQPITAPSQVVKPSPRASKVETFINQGLEKLHRQDPQGALKDFDSAINLDKNHHSAYLYRADIHSQLGHYQKAIEDYMIAKKQNPAFPYIYNQQGKAYEVLGNYSKAIENYTQAIKLYPEDGIGYTNRGIVYHKLKDNKKALDDFNKAIKMNYGQADAYFYRGNLYADLKNNQAAIQDYQKAMALYTEQGKQEGYLRASLKLKEVQKTLT